MKTYRIAWLLFVVQIVSGTMTLSSQTVSPLVAGSANTSYSYAFSAASVTISGGASFVAKFDSAPFNLTHLSGCSMSINSVAIAGLTCSFSQSTSIITMTNITNSTMAVSSVSLQFFTVGASYSTTTNILFYFVDSSGNQNTDSRLNTTLTITTATMASCSANNLGKIVGASTTFSFGFTPVIQISAGSILQVVFPAWFGNSTNLVNNGSANCSSACSVMLLTSTETLTFRSLFTTVTSAAQSVSVFTIKNPPSTAPISIQLIVQTSANQNIQQCSVSLAAETPNNLRASFTLSNRAISASNNFRLNFVNSNPIQGNTSFLRISSPLPLNYTYSAANSQSSTPPLRVSSSDGSVLISGLSTSNISSLTPYFLGLFTLTNPPSTEAVSLTFTTQTLVSGTYYDIDTSTVSVSSVASNITIATISAQRQQIYAIGQFNLSFTAVNSLTTSSFAIIQFPPQLTIMSTSTCTIAVGTCTFSNLTVTVNIDINTTANQVISFSLSQVRNPLTTVTTSTFTINTYYTNLTSLVDTMTSGLTFTATSTTIQSLTVTPSSYTVQQSSTYTFILNLTNPIPSGTSILLTFPASIPLDSSLSYPSSNSLQCTVSRSSQVVTLSGCFTAQSVGNLTFVLSGIKNPYSTKPTESFNITTLFNSAIQEYLQNSLTLTMTTLMDFNFLSVFANNATVGASTSYTFNIGFGSTHSTGDILLINIPTEITLSSVSCTVVSGITSIQCSYSNNVLTAIMNSAVASSISFNVSGFRNNWYISTSTFAIRSAVGNINVYYIEKGETTLRNSAGNMAATTVSDNGITLLSTSSLKLTIQTPFSLSSANSTGLSVSISLPSSSFTANNNCTTNGTCTYLSSINGYNVTSLTANSFPLTVEFQAQTAYFTSTSSTMDIQLRYYGESFASNSNTSFTVYCTSPCKGCSSVKTSCTSCLPSTYVNNFTFYRQNSQCVQNCPDAFFNNASSLECNQCNSNCSKCAGTANNCSGCLASSNTYLYQNTCLGTCPTQYYKNMSTQTCTFCPIGCLTCTGPTVCQTCQTGYLLSNTSCLSSCVNNSFVPVNGVCTACNTNCYTCSGTVTNCTSCVSSLLFYNNTCVGSCPRKTYKSGAYCFDCQSPCVECTSSTVCTTCQSTKSLFDNRTCVDTCPSGTISLAGICQNCSAQCLTCSVLVNNCTTCSGTLLLYNNNTCVAECPFPTHPYGKICTECITPCKTCSGSATNCTSCQGGQYLLNNTCMGQCPAGYYADETTKQCFSCGNCLACISPSNCTACYPQNFLLNGLCYSSCPPSTPILQGQTCVPCSSQCFTCSQIPQNCTSCNTSTFLFRYTCVSTCPLGLYTDRTTNSCLDTLVKRIVFFPLLIGFIILFCLVFLSKCFAKPTVLVTGWTACIAIPEVGSYIYHIVMLTQDEEGVDQLVSLILGLVALTMMIAVSIFFYCVNRKKVKEDPYHADWLQNSCNYLTYLVVIHAALLNMKLYRLVYSRLFNSAALSMFLKNAKTILPLTTLSTLLCIFLSQLLMVASTVLTLYKKNNKDQVFYTAVECLIVTSLSVILSLVDMHKEDGFFSETDYVADKKYVENIKENRKEEVDEISVMDAPSATIDIENCFVTASKNLYTKKDLLLVDSSCNLIDDRISSDEPEQQETEGESIFRRENSRTSKRLVNIFDPIQEEEAEEEPYKSSPRNQLERIVMEAQRKQKSECGDRKNGMAAEDTREVKSLVCQKELRHHWDRIIDDRRKEAVRLFRTPPAKETIEPFPGNETMYRTADLNMPHMRRKRKLKVTKSMKRTQEIYLQRLMVLEDQNRHNVQTSLKKKKKKKKDAQEEYYFPDGL